MKVEEWSEGVAGSEDDGFAVEVVSGSYLEEAHCEISGVTTDVAGAGGSIDRGGETHVLILECLSSFDQFGCQSVGCGLLRVETRIREEASKVDIRAGTRPKMIVSATTASMRPNPPSSLSRLRRVALSWRSDLERITSLSVIN